MNVLSWNCRGLGNPRTVRILRRLVRKKKPDVVFLMETKLVSQTMEYVRAKMKFDGMFVVDCHGRSGGLALMWKAETNIQVQNYSKRHINAIVKNGNNDRGWKFTGFYGNPEATKRSESWSLLRFLSSMDPDPWLCVGDFNEIMSLSEKSSSSYRPPSHMQAFRNALEDSHLSDLGFSGPRFTWCNGRSGEDFTRERLDRAVANGEWTNLFNVVEVFVLPRRKSDHNPLLVAFSNSRDVKWSKCRRFRYEASWGKNRESHQLIKQVWRAIRPSINPWDNFHRKLLGCKRSLKNWVRENSDSVEDKIKRKEQELQVIQSHDNGVQMEEERQIEEELDSLLEQEDLKWQQRAKVNWLQHGDRNSKYFHAAATQKNRRSKISEIQDFSGQRCTTTETIEEAFVSYFRDLFKGEPQLEVDQCIQALDKKVTDAMNVNLVADITEEEISRALLQMPPLKAPGPDGFSASFYQQNWGLVHKEVCQAITHFFNTGTLESSINITHIALIPKVANPRTVSEFRPISLCNVIYKVLSKVLANRLKPILHAIISPTQSAFIPGRLITDNILAAYETMHTMQTRMWSKVGYMGIKLDMSKAYDRVEWPFLEAAMLRMGFAGKWVQWVMTCIKTVSYSVIINGSPVGQIFPSRGIRQGDPISPYLFLICAEALSALLFRAERNGVITGVPTSFRGPRLSHLFFADDSVLFCRSNAVEWRRIIRILGIYEKGSGQKLNLAKTSIFFSRNTSQTRRQEILEFSGLSEAHRIDSYLGLPTFVGKSRTTAFKDIIGKVARRLENWKTKFLSLAGKEVLLKAVVQAIPTYSMGVFQLPIGLCKELNQMMQHFWWSHMSKNSTIHWMSWSKMGRPKSMGGLGFRDLVMFNKAILAKQGWRLMQDPNSMAATIIKAKYFPHSSFLESTLGAKPSYAWRSIYYARDLLCKGLVWRVGDGRKIKIWGDKWLPTPSTFSVQSVPKRLNENAQVAELIDQDSMRWKVDLIQAEFMGEEALIISSIPLNPLKSEDKLIWRCSVNGDFSVRSAYHLGMDLQESKGGQCSYTGKEEDFWKFVWALGIPNVTKLFIWRACNEILPTRVNLVRRRVTELKACPCCEMEDEDALHAMWLCPAARDVWGNSGSVFQKYCYAGTNFKGLLAYCMERGTKEDLELMAVIARRIWLRRNAWLFERRFEHPNTVYYEASKVLLEFKRCNIKEKELSLSEGGEEAQSRRQTHWIPPPDGVIKVNWDAALNVAKGWIGQGIIARNSKGLCLGARSITQQVRTDAKTAETMAALQAMQFCKEAGFWKVIFEGDATQVVKEILSGSPTFSKAGHFIESIQKERHHFRSTSFQAIPRDCNMAAHKLAKMASHNIIDQHWLENTPLSVSNIVFRERSGP
jgi:ribonuclease HI